MSPRSGRMMIGASLFALAVAAPAFGQNSQSPLAPLPGAATPSPGSDRLDCPPGIDERTAPSVGGDTTGSGESVSRQLSESGGIVCPPAGIDAGIVEQPPAGGTLPSRCAAAPVVAKLSAVGATPEF